MLAATVSALPHCWSLAVQLFTEDVTLAGGLETMCVTPVHCSAWQQSSAPVSSLLMRLTRCYQAETSMGELLWPCCAALTVQLQQGSMQMLSSC